MLDHTPVIAHEVAFSYENIGVFSGERPVPRGLLYPAFLGVLGPPRSSNPDISQTMYESRSSLLRAGFLRERADQGPDLNCTDFGILKAWERDVMGYVTGWR